jgi:FkbM family methyltransferase
MTVVDVGAHGGYFSLIAANHVGVGGRVYSFEPHSATFNALRRNIELNGYKNIYAVNKAVADRTGKLKLLLHANGSDRHGLCPNDRDEGNNVSVDTTTLDDFMRDQNWPRVDLIKMDIEGAEPAALTGMRETLARCSVRFVVTEFSPPALEEMGFQPLSFLRELCQTGLSVFTIEEEKRARSLTSSDFSELIRDLRDHGGTNLLCKNMALGDC